jgi:hypothetical protein
MSHPVKIICKYCSSENVVRDAWAAWDVQTQSWCLMSVFDFVMCQACERENVAIEIEIEKESVS